MSTRSISCGYNDMSLNTMGYQWYQDIKNVTNNQSWVQPTWRCLPPKHEWIRYQKLFWTVLSKKWLSNPQICRLSFGEIMFFWSHWIWWSYHNYILNLQTSCRSRGLLQALPWSFHYLDYPEMLVCGTGTFSQPNNHRSFEASFCALRLWVSV